MNFFPRYSQRSILDRISFLAQYASGVYCDQNADSFMFLGLSEKLIDDYNKDKLWQEVMIKALCRVGW